MISCIPDTQNEDTQFIDNRVRCFLSIKQKISTLNISRIRTHTLYKLKTSVVNFVASYHARLLTTWVISVCKRGRTKCFFPSEVRNNTLAKAGTSSLDRLTPNNTIPLILTYYRSKSSKIVKPMSNSIIDTIVYQQLIFKTKGTQDFTSLFFNEDIKWISIRKKADYWHFLKTES